MSEVFGKVKQKTIQGLETQSRKSAETFAQLNANPEESIAKFIKAPWEKVYRKGNSYIVLGKDRSGTLKQGYGAQVLNTTECAAIDLVVGRWGSPFVKNDATGKPEQNNVHPNFDRDAARIYISQKADIDTYMKLVPGRTNESMAGMNNSVAKSAIGLIADEIRLSARGGVKIVTTHSERSHGAFNKAFPKGVDLIAGNDDRDLQPMVKGKNLIQCLNTIIDQISDINGVVNTMMRNQQVFQTILMGHTHISPVGPTSPSVEVIVGGAQKNIKDILSNVDAGLQKANIAMDKLNYFLPVSANYILSRYHNLN
jgi:hypothetical protein